MAWDDTPPDAAPSPTMTAEKPSETSWDAAPPSKDELESPSLGGFLHNAGQDIKGNVVGLGQLAKGLVTEPVKTLSGIPKGLVEEGKRIGVGELATGHPINAVKKFGNAIYDKPLSTGLDVGALFGLGEGVAGAVGKGAEAGGAAAEAGAKALEAGESAAPMAAPETASRLAGAAPEPLSLPKEAGDILNAPISKPEVAPQPTPDATGSIGKTISDLSDKIPGAVKAPMKQVEDYLTEKYGQIAKRPGIANTAADYLEQHSQNMALKDLGAAPGQVRKIGVDRARALADYATDNGLVGPSVGSIGREQMIPARLKDAGGAVGGFRKMAADRGAVHDPNTLISQVREQLDKEYLTGGINADGKNLYLKALSELKKSGGRADDVSETVTDMFQKARARDRLKQPTGPISDVARAVRKINDDAIKSKLTPEEGAAYGHALEDYGALTQINEFVKRRSSTEAGGRLGPGAGISRMAVQKFLDSVGYRVQSKVAGKLADVIRSHPEIMQSPKNIFSHLADEYSEAVDEMGEAQ